MSVNNSAPVFTVEESDPAVEATLLDALIAFNKEKVGASRSHFNVVGRDSAGAVRAGVIAIMGFDVLWLRLVWMDAEFRGRGEGRIMIETAEAEGRRRGAILAWVETFDWQARPFYERLGYTVYAELPHDGGRHARFFLRKTLLTL